MVELLLLLTFLARLNFSENLWTDAGARVSLTSPAPAHSRHTVDPWSRNAIAGNKNTSLNIIYAISHDQLDDSRTSVSPAAPGNITPVIRSSILTSSTCSWGLNTIIMVTIRKVLINKITTSTESTITPPSLLRAKVGGQMPTITPEDPMKWESELETDFIFSLVQCLDNFDASLAIQSDLHNHHRW